MEKIIVGSIPKKICYVYSAKISVITEYPTKNSSEEVYPTFPVDSECSKTLESAKKWAERKNIKYNSINHKYEKLNTPISIDVLNNQPIKDLKLLSLDYRGSGGRAYKVLIHNKYYVDLREDILMDVLLNSECKYGILKGEYIWGKIGKEMKLVRVGSELHTLLEKSNAKKSFPIIKKKDLEIGGIYRSRNGYMSIFLGYVNTVRYSYTSFNDFIFNSRLIKKAMLFFDVGAYKDPKEEFEKIDKSNYLFCVRTKHDFIEKIDHVDIKDDYVTLVRRDACNEIKDDILKFAGNNKQTKISKYTLIHNVCFYSEKLNMYRYQSDSITPFDVKKYLLFS